MTDDLYDKIVERTRRHGRVTYTAIQREFNVSFNEAADAVERMQRDMIIGVLDRDRWVFPVVEDE